MNRFLFKLSDFLSRPPGFYFVLGAMVLCTALVPFGLTEVVTYALSVGAIVITGVVLMQGFRDTAAINPSWTKSLFRSKPRETRS